MTHILFKVISYIVLKKVVYINKYNRLFFLSNNIFSVFIFKNIRY